MNVKLNPRLEAVLNEFAEREAVPPETIVLRALWEKFGRFMPPLEPRDDWERLVLSLGVDCGAGLSDEALSSEGLYD